MLLFTFKAALKRVKEQPVFLGWIQSINLQLQFSSPSHVEHVHLELVKLRLELERSRSNLLASLRSMFPEWSVQEWMLTHFDPVASEVIRLEESLTRLSKTNTFPVRPIPLPASTRPEGGRVSDDHRSLGDSL